MPRELPDVTLVLIDTVAHDLARFALQRTFEQITPVRSLLFSDYPSKIRPENCPPGTLLCPVITSAIQSLADVGAALWHDLAQYINSSHVLICQYDGWVLDGAKFKDHWLDYDYIGAPWPWHRDGLQVGNGGFSLRSTRLLKFLGQNRAQFPCVPPEDDTLCRKYRPILEAEGFRWAPYETAADFSFERGLKGPSFGFHGIFNVSKVLSPDELQVWMSLATPYVRSKVEWKELSQ